MKTKKFTILMIVVSMLLSSCSQEKEADEISISLLYNNIVEAPFNEEWEILDRYRTMKNINFDVIVADNEDYTEYVNQALTSNDPPDIILNCWPETIENYANQGLLLPFSDYIDLMPNFQEYIQNNSLEMELEKLKISDGKYYILPGFQRPIQVQQWIYRKDLYEKHDIAIPQTYDELFDTLLILKGIYPDSTPISASWGGAHLFSMMGAGYGISAGWSGYRSYDEQTDRWFYTHSSDNYKKMLQYLNRCYEAGLLDSEIFTQSNDEFINKLTEGSVFASVSWITSGFDNWDKTLEENGADGGVWNPLSVPESTIGISKLPAVSVFRKGLVIPNSLVENKDFEEILKFIDWAMYSEEGIELTYWGVEGLTFERGDNGNVLLDNIISPKNTDGTIDMSSEYGFNLLFNMNESISYEDYKKPDYIVEFLNQSIENDDTQQEIPDLKLSANEMVIVESITEELVLIANEHIEGFINGELNFEEDWLGYVNRLNDNGVDIIEGIWNDAWQAKD